MTNAVYPKAKQRAGTTGLNWVAGAIKAQLVDTALYTYSAAHEFLSDIPSGARVGAAVATSGRNCDLGVFDAADISGAAISPPGASAEAVVLFCDTGVEGTSYLIDYIDTAASGLPTASGDSVLNIAWDNGANKIFKL